MFVTCVPEPLENVSHLNLAFILDPRPHKFRSPALFSSSSPREVTQSTVCTFTQTQFAEAQKRQMDTWSRQIFLSFPVN